MLSFLPNVCYSAGEDTQSHTAPADILVDGIVLLSWVLCGHLNKYKIFHCFLPILLTGCGCCLSTTVISQTADVNADVNATSPFVSPLLSFSPGAPLISYMLLPLYFLIFYFPTGQSHLELSCHLLPGRHPFFCSTWEHHSFPFTNSTSPAQAEAICKLLSIRPMGAAEQPRFVAFLPPGNATMEQFTFSKCKSGSYLGCNWYSQSMAGLNQLIKWKLHNEWAQKIGLAKLHCDDLFSKVQLIYRFEAFIGAL